MLDTSIPLQVQSLQAPDFLGMLQKSQNIRDMAQQRQLRDIQTQSQGLDLQKQQREANASALARDLMSKNDYTTPEGQQAIMQGLNSAGFGDKAMEFKTSVVNNQIAQQEARNKAALTLADINEKTAAHDKALTEAKNNWLSTHAGLIRGITDPEQRQIAYQNMVKQGADAHHLDMSDMPEQAPSDEQLKRMERVTMKPEDRAKLEYEEKGRELWGGIKTNLDGMVKKAITGPDGRPKEITTAEYNQVAHALQNVPPQVQSLPEYKEYATGMDKIKPQPPMAMMMSQGNPRVVGALISNFSKARTEYEKRAQPYLQLEGIVGSPSFGTKIGDVSMLDKMAIMETGHIPTEAQYAELKSQPGLIGKVAMLREGLANGAKLTKADRDGILGEARAQMRISHDAYKTSIQEAKDQAAANEIDPKKVVTSGGYFDKAEKYLSKADAGDKTGAPASIMKVGEAKQFDGGITIKRSK